MLNPSPSGIHPFHLILIVAGERHFIKNTVNTSSDTKSRTLCVFFYSRLFQSGIRINDENRYVFFCHRRKQATEKIRDLEMAGPEVKCSCLAPF